VSNLKKIFLSLATISLVVLGAVGATYAYFKDSAEVTGVTFSTGNADLQMTQVNMHSWYQGDASAADLGISFPNDLYPGYQGSWGAPDGAMYLGNFSDSPIDLTVKAKVTNLAATNNLENVAQLAIAWGGDCDNAGLGTGFHTLNWWANHSADLFTYVSGSADPTTCGFLPNDHTGGYQGYSKALKFYLKIPTSAGNEIANSNTSFNIHFDAEQVH